MAMAVDHNLQRFFKEEVVLQHLFFARANPLNGPDRAWLLQLEVGLRLPRRLQRQYPGASCR